MFLSVSFIVTFSMNVSKLNLQTSKSYQKRIWKNVTKKAIYDTYNATSNKFYFDDNDPGWKLTINLRFIKYCKNSKGVLFRWN